MPTLCDLAGANAPRDIDGMSLVPILRGEQTRVRSTLGMAYRDVQRAIRDDRWKLIRYPQVDRTQLFDLENDPEELRNLADEPAQAEQLARMTTLLQDWQQTVGDKQPLEVENPKSAEFEPPTE
jgi:arylsulfatase A-like enzyme